MENVTYEFALISVTVPSMFYSSKLDSLLDALWDAASMSFFFFSKQHISFSSSFMNLQIQTAIKIIMMRLKIYFNIYFSWSWNEIHIDMLYKKKEKEKSKHCF